MKIIERKEVTETKLVTVGHRCDNCGKINSGEDIPNDWHEFSGHHFSWGNDSIDSYIHYTVCCPECYFDKLRKAVEEFDGYDDAEIDGFSIEFTKRILGSLDIINKSY